MIMFDCRRGISFGDRRGNRTKTRPSLLSVNQRKQPEASFLLIAGSCATNDYKPRQVRKEAAVVVLFVCRRGAWLSTSYLRGENETVES